MKLYRLIFFGCLLFLSFLLLGVSCLADELQPRRWAHLPIDTNFVGAAYAHTNADIAFDPVLKIEDADMALHTWAAKYTRTFEFLGKSSRIDLLQAYQEGHWSGLLDGVSTKIKRNGLSDTLVGFAINLYGAPPLKGKDYVAYRTSIRSETIVGAGMTLQLPTGDYMKDKLINLGSNRYTFRPQLGIKHSRGKWSVEGTGIVALFTDNDEFFNGHKLEQDPVYSLHGHLIYTHRPGLWAGVSAGYNRGGKSTVDGVGKNDRKENLAYAISVGYPVNRHLGLKAAYIATRTQESVGFDSDTFTIGLGAFW